MSLLDKLDRKEGEKELRDEVRKEVDEEVSKLREYEKLGFIGE
jgi:hypothetical protein